MSSNPIKLMEPAPASDFGLRLIDDAIAMHRGKGVADTVIVRLKLLRLGYVTRTPHQVNAVIEKVLHGRVE